MDRTSFPKTPKPRDDSRGPGALPDVAKADIDVGLVLRALDRLRSGFAIYEPNGGLVYANQVAFDQWPVMFGRLANGDDRRSAAEAEVRAQFPNAAPAQIDELTSYVHGSFVSGLPTDIETADGRVASARHERLADGVVVGVSVDVTRLREQERRLRAALSEAREAARARSEFLADMSHEVRTPLNGVLGLTEVLSATDLDDAQSAYVERIRTSGLALLRFVDELFDFAELESGRASLDRRRFDPRPAIKDVIAAFRGPAREKGLTLDLVGASATRRIVGDERRLQQILANLLRVVIQSTAAGGVVLSVRDPEAGQDEPCVTIDVKAAQGCDDDLNAAPIGVARLLDTDGAGRRRGGNGVRISERLAALMNGRLEMEETANGAVSYRLVMPVDAPA